MRRTSALAIGRWNCSPAQPAVYSMRSPVGAGLMVVSHDQFSYGGAMPRSSGFHAVRPAARG